MADVSSVHTLSNTVGTMALINRVCAGLMTTALLVVGAWSHTFYEMWLRWFPAWNMSTFSGWDRWTKGDSYFTHGPLVPIVSAIMAMMIYKRVGIPSRKNARLDVCGLEYISFFLATHLVSVYARVTFVSGYSLIGVMLGLILIWGGWSLLRLYWIPVTNLLFMIPIPMVWVADLNFMLKTAAVGCAVWLTNTIFHIPTIVEGSTVFLPNLSDGSPKFLIIENVCGGLRSLISLTWFATLFVCLSRVQGKWRWFLLAISLPVAVACNIVRVMFFCVVAHYFGVEAIADDTLLHTLSGMFLFAGAIGVLFVLEKMIAELDRRYMLGFTGPSIFCHTMDRHDSGSNRWRAKFNPLSPLPLMALLACMYVSIGWSLSDVKSKLVNTLNRHCPNR